MSGELDDEIIVPELPLRIIVSTRAARLIVDDGGELYVWTERVGPRYVRLKAATRAPTTVPAFERHVLESGIRAHVTEEARRGGRFRVGRSLLGRALVVDTALSLGGDQGAGG